MCYFHIFVCNCVGDTLPVDGMFPPGFLKRVTLWYKIIFLENLNTYLFSRYWFYYQPHWRWLSPKPLSTPTCPLAYRQKPSQAATSTFPLLVNTERQADRQITLVRQADLQAATVRQAGLQVTMALLPDRPTSTDLLATSMELLPGLEVLLSEHLATPTDPRQAHMELLAAVTVVTTKVLR